MQRVDRLRASLGGALHAPLAALADPGAGARLLSLDGDAESPTGVVAVRVVKKVTSLGPVRASLISKGLIYPGVRAVEALVPTELDPFVLRPG